MNKPVLNINNPILTTLPSRQATGSRELERYSVPLQGSKEYRGGNQAPQENKEFERSSISKSSTSMCDGTTLNFPAPCSLSQGKRGENVARIGGIGCILNKQELVERILGFDPKKNHKILDSATEYAATNFALIKYWGKENDELMIPYTDSISVSLGKNCGTTTEISVSDKDIFILDGNNADDKEFKKVFEFVDLFRPPNIKLKINSKNNLPKSSGLATSASGYAALTLALNKLFNWNLSEKKLSMLARLGSISASRSIYNEGLVRLTRNPDPNFSFSYRLPYKFGQLYVGLLVFNDKIKKFSSRDGMKMTQTNSLLYKYAWKKQVNQDIRALIKAFETDDWSAFGSIIQGNCLAMHATAISAGVIYWSSQTLSAIQKILELQGKGEELCFTEDAGEHIKIIAKSEEVIKKNFSEAIVYKVW